MSGKYANIIIDISHEKLDRTFQYKIPAGLQEKIRPGCCVSIPFGQGNHIRKGYVLEVTDRQEYRDDRMKEIAALEEGTMAAEGRCMELAAWIREHYGSTMIAALKTVLPVKKKVKTLEEKSCALGIPPAEAEQMLAECIRKKQTARVRLLQALLETDPLPVTWITGKLHVSSQTLKGLEEKGVIRIRKKISYRNPVQAMAETRDGRKEVYQQKKVLGQEQAETVASILTHFQQGCRKTSLIHGITGSGKTEVYLALIEEMIQRGRQAIVLIPEIALTYQTLLRFYVRFGDRVSVMNSSLSQGEKYDQWERARKGEIDIMIGPRSALFTPFERLGLIVIDEEHEMAYKSESMPRYHARETAEKIASMQDAIVVLGSATPSLEAYHRARTGSYHLYQMTSRQAGGQLPMVHTIDLRQELRQGNRSVFSRKLQELIRDRLEKGEQIMLFLNRRGYAGFVSCRSCGFVMKCPHCDVSLSEHMGGRLVCHYCGYEREAVGTCPDCGSPYILGFRAGTQQIEELVHKTFPSARVLRMDADTTRKKESYESILNAFANGEAEILLGTQMIVKGHDFPNVTLVGILAADLSLHRADYRAGERTFQLLSQAAGRAGRGEKPGEVVIQTYDPEHYCIVHAARQDERNYEDFYEEEMLYRSTMLYPPAGHLLAIMVISEKQDEVMALAGELARRIREGSLAAEITERRIRLIGPAPASIGKLQDIYRYMLYIKSTDYTQLIQVKDQAEQWMEEKKEQMKIRHSLLQFDFDPMSSY